MNEHAAREDFIAPGATGSTPVTENASPGPKVTDHTIRADDPRLEYAIREEIGLDPRHESATAGEPVHEPPTSPEPAPTPPDGGDPPNVQANAWRRHAEAIADWMLSRIVVRKDVYGSYYEADGQFKQVTTHKPLTRDVLIRHSTGRTIVGAHLISPDGRCLAAVADIDAHDEKANPGLNWRSALKVVELLAGYGLKALILDSNGKGGYHVRVFFKKPVPAHVAKWLGDQVRAALKAEGYPDFEWFPKQAELTLDCPYGNWVRLPGRHHKRDHWTRVFDPEAIRWLDGGDAIRRLVKVAGDDPTPLLNAYEKSGAKAEAGATSMGPKAPTGDRRRARDRGRRDWDDLDEATVREALGFIPNDDVHYDTWVNIGMALHDWDSVVGLDLWEEYSRRSTKKHVNGFCEVSWKTFVKGKGLGIGSIIFWAEEHGWTPPWKRAPEVDKGGGTGGRSEAPRSSSLYAVVSHQLSRRVGLDEEEGEPIWEPMCSFNAWISSTVVHDDGVETTTRWMIDGTTGRGTPLPTAEVSLEEFARLDWPRKNWKTKAVVYAGQGNKDHLRTAIEILSGENVPERVVYTHTGWRQVGGTWVYLHAAGAIGPPKAVEGVVVHLPAALSNYCLPVPPEGANLITAVQSSLDLARDLATDDTVMPLLSALYRSVLGESDFAVFLAGRTHSGKTELAALMQQHFGPAMRAKNLPGNWSSTANALEGIAFAAKDALFTVDDFCPKGGQVDIARQHSDADRLFRAQGNHAGRQRSRTDGSPRASKPPRGLILSTGEDIPRGQSLRARLLILEVSADEVGFENGRLTECQRDAADGLYAQAMAGFLAWLSPRYDQVVREMKADVIRLRDELSRKLTGQHRRTPVLTADLLAAFSLFMRFAVEIGAITSLDAESLKTRCRDSILSAAKSQAAHQVDSDPCRRYLSLLSAAMSSGRAHVAGTDGGCPCLEPGPWGWQEREVWGRDAAPRKEWDPQGRRIGWLDGDNLYLEPDSAYAEVQRMANEQGDAFPMTKAVLHKRLHEQKLLASTDEGRLTARPTIEGKRRRVLHLLAQNLSLPSETGPSGPSGPPSVNHRENRPTSRPTFSQTPENRSQKVGHDTCRGQVAEGDTAGRSDASERGEGEAGSPSDTCRGPLLRPTFEPDSGKWAAKTGQKPLVFQARGPLGPLGPLSEGRGSARAGNDRAARSADPSVVVVEVVAAEVPRPEDFLPMLRREEFAGWDDARKHDFAARTEIQVGLGFERAAAAVIAFNQVRRDITPRTASPAAWVETVSTINPAAPIPPLDVVAGMPEVTDEPAPEPEVPADPPAPVAGPPAVKPAPALETEPMDEPEDEDEPEPYDEDEAFERLYGPPPGLDWQAGDPSTR
ncbi:MAG: PriCT-2 domain-containing protein [Planctomycetaceae bacterium]|nr:PriCT-2 domain-containing protein [Planctomycetaceae bacterium]